jgi:hypothetical protein
MKKQEHKNEQKGHPKILTCFAFSTNYNRSKLYNSKNKASLVPTAGKG